MYDDLAFAAQSLEEPASADLAVLDLVVRDEVGARSRHRRINRNHRDALRCCLFDHGVERRPIGRVDDDRIHALRDQGLDVGDLPGDVGVAVLQHHFVDVAAGERLCLDGADHLLTPGVADERVRHAEREHLVCGMPRSWWCRWPRLCPPLSPRCTHRRPAPAPEAAAERPEDRSSISSYFSSPVSVRGRGAAVSSSSPALPSRVSGEARGCCFETLINPLRCSNRRAPRRPPPDRRRGR